MVTHLRSNKTLYCSAPKKTEHVKQWFQGIAHWLMDGSDIPEMATRLTSATRGLILRGTSGYGTWGTQEEPGILIKLKGQNWTTVHRTRNGKAGHTGDSWDPRRFYVGVYWADLHTRGWGNSPGQGKSHPEGSESELSTHKGWERCLLPTLVQLLKTGSVGLGLKGFTSKVRNI